MIFTRSNVLRTTRNVKAINWLGEELGIPERTRREVQKQFKEQDEQCLKKYIDFFVDHDPLASWRRVIVCLDQIREKEVADDIRHLAEAVTGEDRLGTLCSFSSP